jgi:hypothetical protein
MLRIIVVFWSLLHFSQVQAALEDLSIGAGQVTLNDLNVTTTGNTPEQLSVPFPSGAFATTPAVFILPNNTNTEPMTLRVINVSSTGFDVFVSESQGQDNTVYPQIAFDYLAIEPGDYTIAGASIQVGIETGVTEYVSKTNSGGPYKTISYLTTYNTGPGALEPVVMTQLQSLNSDPTLINGAGEFTRETAPFLELAQQPPTLTNFTVALERAETTAGTIAPGGETVAWMSVSRETDITAPDDGATNVNIKAFYSADNITGNCVSNTLLAGNVTNFSGGTPIYFGNQIRRDGGDGGWLRRCNSSTSAISARVEEDLVDGEQNHTTEQANFFAVSQAFQMSTGDIDSPNINMVVATRSGINAIAQVTGGVTIGYSLTPTFVDFSSYFGADFNGVPVVIPMSSNEGDGEPAIARVWDISSSGFTIAQTVPEGNTAPAESMTVDFLAVVPGTHTLPNGQIVVAAVDSINTCIGGLSSCAGSPYQAQTFGTTLTTPAVLAAMQTDNNQNPLDPLDVLSPLSATSIVDVTATGFDLTIELAQTSIGAAVALAEDIGWIAVGGGVSTALHAAQGSTSGSHLVEMRTVVTTDNVGGWDNGCQSNNFPSAFTLTMSPIVIATHNSRNGGDGGWLRKCAESASNFGLVVDEDVNSDSERSHGSREVAGVIAFSDKFAWTPNTYSNMKLGVTFWDPINFFDKPKAIPGASIDYTVTIKSTSRIGVDLNSIDIVDNMSANTELFVGDIGGSCPVAFTETDSSLIFTCHDDLYLKSSSPPCTPDADGFCPYSDFLPISGDWDPLIESIRFEPKGEFQGMTGSNDPTFSFRYRVRLN